LPILSNVLLETDKGMLKISATDLEKGIVTWTGAKIHEPGVLSVPAKLLLDFVSNHPAAELECSLEKSSLLLKSNTVRAKITGMDASEYPNFSDFKEPAVFVEINPKEFLKCISQTSCATSVLDSRPILTGVLIIINSKGITFVGLDGFRLAKKHINLKDAPAEEIRFVIPAKSIMEAARLFGSMEGLLKISFSKEESLAIFKAQDTFFTSTVLEGEFPDYEAIISKENSTTCSVLLEDFSKAIKLSGVFAQDAAKIVKIFLDGDTSKLKVSSQSEEVGENETDVEAKVQGPSVTVHFNSKYLMDFLNNVDCQELEFCTNGEFSPALLRPKKDSSFIYIAMPVRVTGQ